MNSAVQPFWDQIKEQLKRDVRPKQYDVGEKLYLSGKVRVKSLKNAEIQIELEDKGGVIYPIVLRRESMKPTALLELIRLLTSDIAILQSVLQGKTPQKIMEHLIVHGLYFQIIRKTVYIDCTCSAINRFCRHTIASLHMLVTEMPDDFHLFLAFCGFDPEKVYQIIHDIERRERRLSTTYHDFWIGSDDHIVDISPLTTDEYVPPGIWYMNAPQTVEPYIADIEGTRQKVATKVKGILKKSLMTL